MIYYVATELHMRNTWSFLQAQPAMQKMMTALTYEELFFQRGGPVGHYIFTDHDRLSRFELDCVSAFCARLAKAAPDARVLNHPATVKDRFPLLAALREAGINSFAATRVETGARPPEYPVFIRAEDGCRGPETGLIKSDAEYDYALENLKTQGKTRRGRVAIGYAAQAGDDGFFRKYGAFRIGGDILPHHIHLGRHWVVKQNVQDTEFTTATDRNDRLRDRAVQEELAYVRDNPHRDTLRRAFDIAEIDFGRIDYGIVDGRIEVYEINTNPKLPLFARSDVRNAVRAITKPQILDGFSALETPIQKATSLVQFRLPRPQDHKFKWPIKHLHRAIWQRANGLLTKSL